MIVKISTIKRVVLLCSTIFVLIMLYLFLCEAIPINVEVDVSPNNTMYAKIGKRYITYPFFKDIIINNLRKANVTVVQTSRDKKIFRLEFEDFDGNRTLLNNISSDDRYLSEKVTKKLQKDINYAIDHKTNYKYTTTDESFTFAIKMFFFIALCILSVFIFILKIEVIQQDDIIKDNNLIRITPRSKEQIKKYKTFFVIVEVIFFGLIIFYNKIAIILIGLIVIIFNIFINNIGRDNKYKKELDVEKNNKLEDK